MTRLALMVPGRTRAAGFALQYSARVLRWATRLAEKIARLAMVLPLRHVATWFHVHWATVKHAHGGINNKIKVLRRMAYGFGTTHTSSSRSGRHLAVFHEEAKLLHPDPDLSRATGSAADSGTPYSGALDRLIRIHRESTEPHLRTAALAVMTGVAPRARMLQYLKDVAESADTTAASAVTFLVRDANGGNWALPPTSPSQQRQSAAVLRSLYARGRVTSRFGAIQLRDWIAFHGKREP